MIANLVDTSLRELASPKRSTVSSARVELR